MLPGMGRGIPSASGIRDTQTVTTGASGSFPDRIRGYLSGAVGSINDGTSNIYSGAAITALYYQEDGVDGSTGTYVLAITGATNTGWDSITIGSYTLTRASASFGSGEWSWSVAHDINSQKFGAAASVVTVTFS